MEAITFTPIGGIRTPHATIAGVPGRNVGAEEVPGGGAIAAEDGAGLRALAGVSPLILLYHLHQMRGYALTVRPYIAGPAGPERGIFATRSPRRPNALGLTVVRLAGVRGATLDITGVDMLDGTPLLDIKPYVPAFDAR